ncbi:MAG: DUF2075 domain-containing protein [Dehalococcoidia bacterium]|nr:DUF2075 domain-containing protein [Dehalococcoidia bacterium]
MGGGHSPSRQRPGDQPRRSRSLRVRARVGAVSLGLARASLGGRASRGRGPSWWSPLRYLAPGGPSVETDDRLYLEMNVRSPRAERLNQWMNALLDVRIDDARRAFPDGREYQMALTRSLDAARAWLRDHTDEDQRAGLLASAEARRLRA